MNQDIINHRFLEESVFAIADGYCVINLTKNIVPGFMYQVVDGKVYNLNEQLGLPENSSLQSLVDAWALTIPEEGLQDFLKDIVVIMEQRAKEGGIQIQFKSRGKGLLYPYVYGSPVHLRQIFLNIYGNCIKYNRLGGKITTVADYTEAVDGITTYSQSK